MIQFLCPALIALSIPGAESEPKTIKVLSYNVQFLPGPARLFNRRGDALARAPVIAERVKDYDLVGFNEVFDDAPRERLLSELQGIWKDHFFMAFGPKPKVSSRYSGGLAIGSKRPIVESNSVIYDNISRIKDYGFSADEFASKGVLHARIAANGPNETFDVFITHLDARDASMREKQYLEMAAFIKKHSAPSRPALIMGDMNTRGGESERNDKNSQYHKLLSAFRAARPNEELIDVFLAVGQGPAGTSDQDRPDGGRRIDYILISNPAAGSRLVPRAARVERFLDKRFGALSDHNGVEAVLDWKR